MYKKLTTHAQKHLQNQTRNCFKRSMLWYILDPSPQRAIEEVSTANTAIEPMIPRTLISSQLSPTRFMSLPQKQMFLPMHVPLPQSWSHMGVLQSVPDHPVRHSCGYMQVPFGRQSKVCFCVILSRQ